MSDNMADDILDYIEQHGPSTAAQIREGLGGDGSMNLVIGALVTQHRLVPEGEDNNKIFYLNPNPPKPGSQRRKTVPSKSKNDSPTSDSASAVSAKREEAAQTLEDPVKADFIKRLIGSGVSPKEVVPTLADIFFSADIDDMEWLDQVLSRDGAGFINPRVKRIIMRWWATSRSLPYENEEVDEDVKEKGSAASSKKKQQQQQPKPSLSDLGVGWMIKKKPIEGWIPIMGGDMTYAEALQMAERRALIDNMPNHNLTEEENEDTEEMETPTSGSNRRKKSAPADDIMTLLMKKMIDRMFDDKASSSSDDRIRSLEDRLVQYQQEIQKIQQEKSDQRLETIEGAVAQLLSRDPVKDLQEMQRMQPTLSTDSPSVKILTDTSDKLDRSLNRFTGLIERVLVKEVYKPENARTPAQREAAAGQLLENMDTNDIVKAARRKTFGK